MSRTPRHTVPPSGSSSPPHLTYRSDRRFMAERGSLSGGALPSWPPSIAALPSRRGGYPYPVAGRDADLMLHRLSLGEAIPFPLGPGSHDPGPPRSGTSRFAGGDEAIGIMSALSLRFTSSLCHVLAASPVFSLGDVPALARDTQEICDRTLHVNHGARVEGFITASRANDRSIRILGVLTSEGMDRGHGRLDHRV